MSKCVENKRWKKGLEDKKLEVGSLEVRGSGLEGRGWNLEVEVRG